MSNPKEGAIKGVVLGPMGAFFGAAYGAIKDYLFPDKSSSFDSPRIGSVRIQRSAYGVPIPIVYGKTRIAGNIMFIGDLVAIPHTDTQSTGGKGGGSITSSNTTWTYQIPMDILLCEGPIKGIGHVWTTRAVNPSFLVRGEGHTAPSSAPYQVTATPPGGLGYTSDNNLVCLCAKVNCVDDSGNPGWFYMPMRWLDRGTNNPPDAGYYYVDELTGVYTFNPADLAQSPYIAYQDSDWFKQNGAWIYMGFGINRQPVYQAWSTIKILAGTYPTDQVLLSYYYGPTALDDFNLALFKGTYPQSAPGWMSSYKPSYAIPYAGIAHLFSTAIDMGTTASPPNFSFEVIGLFPFGGGIEDSNPKDIVYDFITNDKYGAIGSWFADHMDDLTQFSNYCIANGLFLSKAIDSQTSAVSVLNEIFTAANSAPVWSGSKLKIVPYGDTAVTGNGVTYTPQITPVADLTDDDFKTKSPTDAPITVSRKSNQDAYNVSTVEFLDQDISYNPNVSEFDDQSLIDKYGRRPASSVALHCITSKQTADFCSLLLLQRNAYLKNTYQFALGMEHILLEPMDIVTMTHSLLGFSQYPVRIIEIEEDEEGYLKITAEDFIAGLAHARPNITPGALGNVGTYNLNPGNVNPPVMFEPPDFLAGALEIWMGVSGQTNYWGGCEVWASLDNATYRQIGVIDSKKARQGVLTMPLPSGSAWDTTNTLSVDLSESLGQLLSATDLDAQAGNTLCYVGGELISYATANLTAANKYDLTRLQRGMYESQISAHNAGDMFCRIDNAIFKYPFSIDDIGKTIYLKFLSFNTFGGGKQALSDVESYQYVIAGSALSSNLPNVQNLNAVYRDNHMTLVWDSVVDFRSPILYEIRKGSTFDLASVVGVTLDTSFIVPGDDTFWVTARYDKNLVTLAYSPTPASIEVTGSQLPTNVIQSYDEQATGWSGTLSNLTSATGVLSLDAGQAQGIYTVPDSHIVDIGYVATCTLSANYVVEGVSASLVGDWPDVASIVDIAGRVGKYASAVVQIALSNDAVTYGAWQNWRPGQYTARAFKMRIVIGSTDPNLATVIQLSAFSWAVDMPDVIDQGTDITISDSGTAISFNKTFKITPNVQITVLDAQAGDTITFTAGPTSSGFTVKIMNGGSGVARHINWLAKGY